MSVKPVANGVPEIRDGAMVRQVEALVMNESAYLKDMLSADR